MQFYFQTVFVQNQKEHYTTTDHSNQSRSEQNKMEETSEASSTFESGLVSGTWEEQRGGKYQREKKQKRRRTRRGTHCCSLPLFLSLCYLGEILLVRGKRRNEGSESALRISQLYCCICHLYVLLRRVLCFNYLRVGVVFFIYFFMRVGVVAKHGCSLRD